MTWHAPVIPPTTEPSPDILVIDQSSSAVMDRWDRAGLVRSALLTDAAVTFPREHDRLHAAGGVAATLRFRPDV